MSVIASPIQQGPAPANTQTRIHNNTLKIASVGGGQNAVYHVVGGAITDNVNVTLPPLAADDTIATLSANNNWSGVHTFGAGLNSQGPITATAINASGPITTNDALVAVGGITSVGPMTAQGPFTTKGNFNAANLATPGTLSVGTTATITGAINLAGTTTMGALTSAAHTVNGAHQVNGSHTVTGTVNLSTVSGNVVSSGPHVINAGITVGTVGSLVHNAAKMYVNPTNSAFAVGGGHLQLTNQTGGNDLDYFGVQTGSSKGAIIATSPAQSLGFFGGYAGGGTRTATQPFYSGGFQYAGATYGSNEQIMLTDVQNALHTMGLIN